MNMDVKISNKKHGVIGLCGHIGVGHSHSHSGFVQDDSCGLTVAASILKEALPIDSRILSVNADIKNSTLTIKTRDGGEGQTQVRRGITPAEAKLLEKIVGKDTIYNQRIVIEALGRIYGQGVLELPVGLQGALALALVEIGRASCRERG